MQDSSPQKSRRKMLKKRLIMGQVVGSFLRDLCGTFARRASGLEFAARDAALTNDGLQRTRPKFVMVWHGHRDRCIREPLLHDDVATALTHFHKTMPRQNNAYVLPGQNAQFTQRLHPHG